MPNESNKILLVEDDESLGFVIKDNLTIKGFDVTWCKDGNEGYKVFSSVPFTLCILDVMLPGKDGFSLSRAIRTTNQTVPILFLTAKSMTEDKLEGFKAGGDDYIVKPFIMEELIYRIHVFLRRVSVSEEKNFRIGHYQFSPEKLCLTSAAVNIALTAKEAQVLSILCKNRHRIVKREEILKHVWGDDDYFMGRSLDVFISKLRKYLKEDATVQIVNYHGIGFRLEDEVISG